MALDLDQMRSLVRRGLGGLSESDLDTATVDLYLNMSLWELESKFPFKEKECRRDAVMVMGQEEYELPSNLDAIVSVSIMVDGERKKLRRMDIGDHDEVFRDDVVGTPTHYKRRGNSLVVFPRPNTTYPLSIVMWKSIESLVEGEVEAPNLPRNWHEIVVEGAIVRGHFFQEDYDEAAKAKNFQIGNVRSAVPVEAKDQRDSRTAGLQPYTGRETAYDPREYGFKKSFYGGQIP